MRAAKSDYELGGQAVVTVLIQPIICNPGSVITPSSGLKVEVEDDELLPPDPPMEKNGPKLNPPLALVALLIVSLSVLLQFAWIFTLRVTMKP